MWVFKFPIETEGNEKGSQFIEVSTTRPETMLGDTAVAVHPNGNKNKHEWMKNKHEWMKNKHEWTKIKHEWM